MRKKQPASAAWEYGDEIKRVFTNKNTTATDEYPYILHALPDRKICPRKSFSGVVLESNIMNRAYYSESIEGFLARSEEDVLGRVVRRAAHDVELTQRDAWREQIRILKSALANYRGRGKVYFEYAIPRLGGRIDAVLLIGHVIFVLEFKVGAKKYERQALDQVCDYALDLKNFHETSHAPVIAPILIATAAKESDFKILRTLGGDELLSPLKCNAQTIAAAMDFVLQHTKGAKINPDAWEQGSYLPTPTIVEAAMALYGDHAVSAISRNDAGAVNLMETSRSVADIIQTAQEESRKVICFVTGVPGAGKTLVGLDIATKHMKSNSKLYSVFLSGNGPLVDVLREALAKDKVQRERKKAR